MHMPIREWPGLSIVLSDESSSVKITIGPSRRKPVMLLVISLIFTIGGIARLVVPWSRGKPDSQPDLMKDWGGLLFFGLCTLVAIVEFIHSRPQIVINDKGVLLRMDGTARIPWPDIKGAYIKSVYNGDQEMNMDIICLEIPNPDRYLRRMYPTMANPFDASTHPGLTPIILNPFGYAADPLKVLELIQKQINGPTQAMSRPNA
jgi:hypothetical protein